MQNPETKQTFYNIDRFPGQRDSEHVRLVVLKHWVIYARMVRQFILYGILPFAGLWALNDSSSLLVKELFVFFLFFYFSVFLVVLYIRWLDEMLDLLVITNERLISIEQVNIFHNSTSETTLTMIQDVKAKKQGIFSNLLEFGSLEIQTAAEKIEFTIHDINDPYGVSKKILEIRDEALHNAQDKKHI